jgi:hypothetical protein
MSNKKQYPTPNIQCPIIKEKAMKLLKVAISLMLVSRVAFGAMVSSVSQHGITWTFDKQYEAGQFCNGDWWVVGPVSITKIDPASINSGGRTINGTMVNPSPKNGATQGYDSKMYGNYGPVYSAAMNKALGISASNPLTVPVNSTVVSTISRVPEPTRPASSYLQTAAVLTVMTAAVPAGSFRPPYCGTTKTVKFNQSQLTYSYFQSLAPVSGTPTMASVVRKFERVWLNHVPQWMGESYLCPVDNMANYGREVSYDVGDGALMLNLNFTNAEKEALLTNMVQVGIDNYGVITDGGEEVWKGMGGFGSGRFFTILLAGLALGDAELSDIGNKIASNNGPYHFGDTDQTFYVTQAEVDKTNSTAWNPDTRGGMAPYTVADIGLPEWAIGHLHRGGNDDNKAWTCTYRLCCTALAWSGFILGSQMMGIKEHWHHDAIFDYMDRYAVNQAYDLNTQFAKYMWVMYRKKFGGTWTPNNPSDKYSQGQLDYSNCQYHCTRIDDKIINKKTTMPVKTTGVYSIKGDKIEPDRPEYPAGVYFTVTEGGGLYKVVKGIK